MKRRNKSKDRPPPSSSPLQASSPPPPSLSSSPNEDVSWALKALPSAILAISWILSEEDREVLAYMITRSMKTTNNDTYTVIDEKGKRPSTNNSHRHHCDCGCFYCFARHWFRWNSSPNRALIDQAMETFEEHWNTVIEQSNKKGNGEQSNKKGRRKKKAKGGLRDHEKRSEFPEVRGGIQSEIQNMGFLVPEKHHSRPKKAKDAPPMQGMMAMVVQEKNQRGLLRKELPDLLASLGLRLWSPKV